MARSAQTEKANLRAEVASRLAALSPAQKQAASGAVRAAVGALPEWRAVFGQAGRARSNPTTGRENSGFMLFMPSDDEPDVQPLAKEVLSAARVALPRVMDWQKREMDAAWVDNLSVAPAGDLKVTRHGVRQPVAGCPAADLAQIDFVVVPGRAFDKLCNRLGRGGGFYDVLLRRAVFAGREAGRRPVLVGVCFDEQVVERVPVDALDEPLDIVVTPTAVYKRM